LVFEHASDRLTVNLRGGTGHQEYFRTPAFGVNLFDAGAQLSTRVTTRLQAQAAAAYVHSPYYQTFQSFGPRTSMTVDGAMLPFSPYAAGMLENETVEASAGLTGQLTRRSSLEAFVYRRQTRFAQQPEDDLAVDGYRATWRYKLRRDLGLHAGYGREHADQQGPEGRDFDNEIIDVGVDFNREFSVARRTTLGLATSTSFIQNDSSSDREFRMNGSVSLSKHFRRTWHAMVEARRDTSFVPGFVEPLFSDTVAASVGGMFSERIDWMASVSGGKGQYAFSGSSGFETVSATSRLSIALSRHLGLYAQYVAYGYEVPKDATTLDLPDRLARQVIAVGFQAYLPVYNKTRQP
jgi:hypothetical protein